MFNTKIVYNGDDLNTAIYPESSRYSMALDDPFENAWVTSEKFYKGVAYGFELDDTSNLEPIPNEESKYYVYGFYDLGGITGSRRLIYPVTDITQEFLNSDNATGIFNNIRMKKVNGILYFNLKDLYANGVNDY